MALPIAGGAPNPPDRSESQVDQSIHQLPSCLVAFSRQVSDDLNRAGGSTAQYLPLLPGILILIVQVRPTPSPVDSARAPNSVAASLPNGDCPCGWIY